LIAADLVGTWRPVAVINTRPDGSTVHPLGLDPQGILVFESNGRFAFILNRPDLPRFASNNRNAGTAEENKAIVQGSFAYFGTYAVANRTVTMHVEGGTWPGWFGSDLERLILSFSDDEMRWTDPTPSIGGTIENVWTRTR
jgi:Lipocalin-like domain